MIFSSMRPRIIIRNITEDNTFKYYDFINAKDKDEFDEYVSKVKSKTPYKIDTTAEYGDKLVTLSTCAYHASEGRYVVVAKRKTK